MQIDVERAVLKMSEYNITLIIRWSTGYENYWAVRIAQLIFTAPEQMYSAPEQMYSSIVQEKDFGKNDARKHRFGLP